MFKEFWMETSPFFIMLPSLNPWTYISKCSLNCFSEHLKPIFGHYASGWSPQLDLSNIKANNFRKYWNVFAKTGSFFKIFLWNYCSLNGMFCENLKKIGPITIALALGPRNNNKHTIQTEFFLNLDHRSFEVGSRLLFCQKA